ncbi:hypothetical protein [Flavobacterium psychrotrophum]|uniref:hypothetical protein n=1 Tax=Flavobacterium psychrotrophum TaxID=2294119 RepID=UPI000E3160A5|nr:hypothetical protein [Flavobacterium psychrotrophum]
MKKLALLSIFAVAIMSCSTDDETLATPAPDASTIDVLKPVAPITIKDTTKDRGWDITKIK